ncbi:hypothetical protein OROMI_034648 [Orobanche minor]
MEEIWERAVATALDGQADVDLVRALTLDGVVKCVHGRLPPPSLFEKFHNLQHLSMANIGISFLEQFPRLRNLQKLILSDNRIAGGLEFLVAAGLDSLRDLDLSNNRISNINDLRPLAELRLVSLDLYECPVTRMKDYRSGVFSLIRSLKYLDKMDAEENERPESDDEEEDEDDDEDDPGSGEVDGDDHQYKLNNGEQVLNDVVVDVDEDEESDADEEEAETSTGVNGTSHVINNIHGYSNRFRVEAVNGEKDEDEGEEDDDSVEEVYEDDESEDEDVVEVHDINGSDGEDGVEDEEDDGEDDEEDDEEVDNDESDYGGPESTSRLTSTEGEIDGHEQGEDDADEDDDGETGEEEQAVEEDGDFEDEEEAEDEEDDHGSGYLVQPVGRTEVDPLDEREDPEMEEDVEDEDEEDDHDDGEVQELPPSSHKRKRSDDDDDDDDDDDGDEDAEDEDDHLVQFSKSSKHG